MMKTSKGGQYTMRGILNYMEQFTEMGGMLYIMVGLFLIGFFLKTIGNFHYDVLLEKIENGTWKNYQWVTELADKLSASENKENLYMQIKRGMRNWSFLGIPVEYMPTLGDALAGIILIFGVYSYLTVSIVLGITLKIWDKILAVDYKRHVIQDELYVCLTSENYEELQEKIAVVNVEIKKDEQKPEPQKDKREPEIKKPVIQKLEPKKTGNFTKSKEEVFDEILNEFLS